MNYRIGLCRNFSTRFFERIRGDATFSLDLTVEQTTLPFRRGSSALRSRIRHAAGGKPLYIGKSMRINALPRASFPRLVLRFASLCRVKPMAMFPSDSQIRIWTPLGGTCETVHESPISINPTRISEMGY